jgi:PIN domain nuclease of toxin-antitoxin system
VRLLLDAHALLWWLTDDRRLTVRAREAIASPSSSIHVSAATIWEIEIKAAIGRLRLGDVDLVARCEAEGFSGVPVTAAHAQAAARLPRHHADPFDRMLVAQCRMEGLTCVTRDRALSAYAIPLVW